MQRIRLHGQHAVGVHSYALVDDKWFDQLNRYRWKAKPNGSGTHVYAVRNAKGSDGVVHTIRMHRVVSRYEGPLDIDHVNHNTLDNREENLRVATRSENQLNRRRIDVSIRCAHCCEHVTRTVKAGSRPIYCSADCKNSAQRALPHSPLSICHCRQCGKAFAASYKTKAYCSDSCKMKWKRANWRKQGTLTSHYAKAAIAAKAWREKKRQQAVTCPLPPYQSIGRSPVV